VKNFLVTAAVACFTALALAACTSSGHTGASIGGPKLPAKAGVPSGTEQAAQAVNERGFITRTLGEQACFGGADLNCGGGVSFSIDQVDIDPPCVEFGSHPDNGHTVVLHLRVATGGDADAVNRASGVINPFSFVEIGKDGITRDTSFGMCVDPSANQLPATYGPNQQYQGVMDLEVTEASGTIALQLIIPDENGARGWEWTYPV
jgi:hypothetical protein